MSMTIFSPDQSPIFGRYLVYFGAKILSIVAFFFADKASLISYCSPGFGHNFCLLLVKVRYDEQPTVKNNIPTAEYHNSENEVFRFRKSPREGII